MVFCHLSAAPSLNWGTVSLSFTLMMCLSDANEWFLHSSVPPPRHAPFSSSLHLPAWSVRETAERDFSTAVMKLPQGDSKGKLGWLSSFLPALAIWWMEVFKSPDYFCWTVRLSGSQLAVRRECLGRWCKGWKVCRWSCWDRKARMLCVWVCVPTVCAYKLLCVHVWLKWNLVWRRAQCDALYSHDWLHSEPALLCWDWESQ